VTAVTARDYISTVVPEGYARYAVRLNGLLLGVCDAPLGSSVTDVTDLARRSLLGERLPESVKFWPVSQ